MSKAEMAIALRQGVCRVEFTKVDGSHRIMMATLNPQEIPAPAHPGLVPTDRKPNPHVLPVYDVIAQGWRSFKVANVLSFDVLTLV